MLSPGHSTGPGPAPRHPLVARRRDLRWMRPSTADDDKGGGVLDAAPRPVPTPEEEVHAMRRRIATLAAVSVFALALGAAPALAGSPAVHLSWEAAPANPPIHCGANTYTIVSGYIDAVMHEGTSASGNLNYAGTVRVIERRGPGPGPCLPPHRRCRALWGDGQRHVRRLPGHHPLQAAGRGHGRQPERRVAHHAERRRSAASVPGRAPSTESVPGRAPSTESFP